MRALIKIPLDAAGRRTLVILPAVSLLYLIVFLLIMLAALFLLDRMVLSHLASEGTLSSKQWDDETVRIDRNNLKKVIKHERPGQSYLSYGLWTSDAFKVDERKTKSRRILVMGDSFVWGSGYANMNDIWWRQLQRELLRRGYDDVEVIAAGFNGASTRHQLDLFREIVSRYPCDLVIWSYVTNDPDEGAIPCADPYQKDFLFKCLRKFDEGYPEIFSNLVYHLIRGRDRKLASRRTYTDETGYPYEQWEERLIADDNLARYEGTLTGVAGELRKRAIPGFFLTLPISPDRAYYEKRYRAVKPVFERAGLAFHDILPDFAARYREPRPILQWGINPANGHPGITATHFYAVMATDILETHYAAVLPPRKSPPDRFPVAVNDWMPPEMPVSQSGATITLTYPDSDDRLLRMPRGVPFVQLSLDMPVLIDNLTISGPGLTESSLIVEPDDPEERTEIFLGTQEGGSTTWEIAARNERRLPINAIKISATFASSDRSLIIRINGE